MGFSIWIYVFGFSRCNGLIKWHPQNHDLNFYIHIQCTILFMTYFYEINEFWIPYLSRFFFLFFLPIRTSLTNLLRYYCLCHKWSDWQKFGIRVLSKYVVSRSNSMCKLRKVYLKLVSWKSMTKTYKILKNLYIRKLFIKFYTEMLGICKVMLLFKVVLPTRSWVIWSAVHLYAIEVGKKIFSFFSKHR